MKSSFLSTKLVPMEEDAPYRSKLRVLIVDDHPMIREGLQQMLHSANKFYMCEVEEAEEGEEAVKMVIHKPFQVAIVDYRMKGMQGDQTIEAMLRYKPALKVLAMSNYDEVGYIRKMMDAGAMGYILKDIEPAELFRALRTIMAGNTYYSSEVATRLLEAKALEDRYANGRNKYGLSERELEVLRLIAAEKTSEEIAKVLHVSKRTVDAHRNHIMSKVGAKNAVGLIKLAFELHLI